MSTQQRHSPRQLPAKRFARPSLAVLMAGVTPPQQPPNRADDIEYLASGSLTKRGEGERAVAAAAAPSRRYVYRKNADYDSLIEACTRKLAVHPNNVRALMIRANSYMKKGERPPSHLPALNRRPGCCRRALTPACRRAALRLAGLLEEAVRDYSVVLGREPGHVDAAYQRGAASHKLGRLEQAISDFSLVLSLEPGHAKAAYSRAACNNLAGRYDEANGGWARVRQAAAPAARLCCPRSGLGSRLRPAMCCLMCTHMQPTMSRRLQQTRHCPTAGGIAPPAARPACTPWAAWAACTARQPPAPARCRQTAPARAARPAARRAGPASRMAGSRRRRRPSLRCPISA